jgi:predicted nuclease of restriction endonuclease-like (RecB) superfamily
MAEKHMNDKKQPAIVKSHDVHLDSEYVQWIHDVKKRYRNTQIKAAIKINSEQLLFNWQLGRDLVMRRAEEKWGSGIVEQVSLDLQNEFPEAKGFSTTNLWYMKKWYSFYASEENSEKLQQLVGELEKMMEGQQIRLDQVGSVEKLQQVVGEIGFPQAFAYVPWGHHTFIITKCKTIEEAFFYIHRTIAEGLSRNALRNLIKADMYHSAGAAITNFDERLSAVQGRLAQEITKDTYDLGFITLPEEYDETALEDALEQNITRFLLELGTGFAFVGRQKEIIVSGKTRKIDMLFYHIRLRCYVVVELKVVPFEPEFAGKLNFYVNAVDELLKMPNENPTIGLLICNGQDETEVRWAFRGIDTPMGVASYDNIQTREIQEQLPTAEQIQDRIRQVEQEFKLHKDDKQ